MRYFQSKLLVMFLAVGLAAAAQINPDSRLHQAFLLAQQGEFRVAIDQTKSLVDSGKLNGAELGRAWALLGFSYKEQGQFAEAQHALDESVHTLGHNRDYLDDYAVALNYEGSLNEEEGQLDAAEHVWRAALGIFENDGNRAASAEIYRSLAELKLTEKNFRQARKFFERALNDSAAGDLTSAGRAAYASTEGWLDLGERRFPEAVSAYKRSLDFCEAAFGDNHYLTGWDFVLLGNALAQEGQLDQALSDMRGGLDVLERTVGPKNPKYWVAELAYSEVLDRAGSHSQAAEMKKSAERAMEDVYGRRCANCTISVSALR